MTRLEEIHQFIKENYLFDNMMIYDNLTDFCETGIMDENNFLLLISFLEERFHIYFNDDELIVQNFKTIEKINTVLKQKTTGMYNL